MTGGAGPVAVLARGDVDVWAAEPSALDAAEVRAACEALLTDDERARQRAFVFERNRREGLLTRALVRSVLSRYRPTAPGAWRFARNAHGRPHLDPPCGLSFNLSNHPTLVVCAVTEGREIGVDVEPVSRGPAIVDLGGAAFTDEERDDLRRLQPPERLERAVTLWTLKEAYVKARGQGLSLPVDAVAFRFTRGEPRLSVSAAIDDRPDRWWFQTFDLAGHRIAVAVERAGPTPPSVRLRWLTPAVRRRRQEWQLCWSRRSHPRAPEPPLP